MSSSSTTLRFRGNKLGLNWGCSTTPVWDRGQGTIINRPAAVAKACDKLTTFDLLRGHVSIPEYALTPSIPQQWVDEGYRVYGRRTLTGHSGQGIIIFNEGDEITANCLLYTKNTKAKYEYRIHVMAGKVIDVQQKRKREGFEGGIVGIRNHVNGWVFCREGINLPSVVSEQAIKAVATLGLDFGAVDVGYREIDNMAFVYEVNTAPGLEGTTLEKYTQAIITEYLE